MGRFYKRLTMIGNDSHLLWRISKLGIVFGAIFGALTELSLRLAYVYERRIQEEVPLPVGMYIEMAGYPFHWWYLPLLSCALVIPASLLVHCYLLAYTKSPIWFWQTTGLTVTFALYLLNLSNDMWNARLSDMGSDYWQFAWSFRPGLWLCLLLTMSLFSLVYALAEQLLKSTLRNATARSIGRSSNDSRRR